MKGKDRETRRNRERNEERGSRNAKKRVYASGPGPRASDLLLFRIGAVGFK